MLSFDENGWLFPDPLKNITQDIDSAEIDGFVEGTNSKLKMIKRTVYGRCSKALLAAKLMYTKIESYG